MGRGKREIKRIENKVRRKVTFSKRRPAVLKKAQELAVLCDVHLGVVIFSPSGELFDYCSPRTSWSELMQRYERITNSQLQRTAHENDQIFTEMARLRRERDRLEASLRRQTREDLSSVATVEELDNLQQQLERALGKVHEMKDKLLNQQLHESHNKMNKDWRYGAAAEATMVATGRMEPPNPEVEELSTSLQLWPQKLPVVQDFGLQDHNPEVEELSTSLQLWPQKLPVVQDFGSQDHTARQW